MIFTNKEEQHDYRLESLDIELLNRSVFIVVKRPFPVSCLVDQNCIAYIGRLSMMSPWRVDVLESAQAELGKEMLTSDSKMPAR